MARILKEKDVREIIVGTTVLGGGGGGSIQGGLDLLEKYKETHKEEIEVNLISADEIKDGAYTAITAGMGSPLALKDKDFTPYVVNSYEALVDMAAKMNPPRDLECACAVEMGGFNTFVPMLIAIMKGIPFIDADGAGRAVPALDTLLLHVNGCDTSPLAMADHKNNRVMIELADKRDASEAENVGRNICVAFDMISGLSGWMLTKDEIKNNIANGTVSYAQKIGESIGKFDGTGNVFDFLAAEGFNCKAAGSGEVTKVEAKIANGFDYGEVHIDGENGEEIKILFQNENLVIYCNGEVVMTAPDIICVFDKETKIPLTNADVKEGQKVDVGLFKVDERWWKTGVENVNNIWKTYFKNVDYAGDIISYK